SIIGSSLKEFVEKEIIKEEITINASNEKVWEVLLDSGKVNSWANAFSEGAHVETTWNQGAAVVWKDAAGDIGARGVVKEKIPASLLKVVYYDEIDAAETTPLGEYYESYALFSVEGKTQLK